MSVLSNMKSKKEGRWQDDPPTEKQRIAINNMGKFLGWGHYYPATKGETAEIIEDMKKKVESRINSNNNWARQWDNDDFYYAGVYNDYF